MVDERHPVRPEFRDYQLASRFGWTFSEINDQPAVWLDWLLAIDEKAQKAELDAGNGKG